MTIEGAAGSPAETVEGTPGHRDAHADDYLLALSVDAMDNPAYLTWGNAYARDLLK